MDSQQPQPSLQQELELAAKCHKAVRALAIKAARLSSKNGMVDPALIDQYIERINQRWEEEKNSES